jgi:hypothetical protein
MWERSDFIHHIQQKFFRTPGFRVDLFQERSMTSDFSWKGSYYIRGVCDCGIKTDRPIRALGCLWRNNAERA